MKKIKSYDVRVVAHVKVFATNQADAKARAQNIVLSFAANVDHEGVAEVAGWATHAIATSAKLDTSETYQSMVDHGFEYDTTEESYT